MFFGSIQPKHLLLIVLHIIFNVRSAALDYCMALLLKARFLCLRAAGILFIQLAVGLQRAPVGRFILLALMA